MKSVLTLLACIQVDISYHSSIHHVIYNRTASRTEFLEQNSSSDCSKRTSVGGYGPTFWTEKKLWPVARSPGRTNEGASREKTGLKSKQTPAMGVGGKPSSSLALAWSVVALWLSVRCPTTLLDFPFCSFSQRPEKLKPPLFLFLSNRHLKQKCWVAKEKETACKSSNPWPFGIS